jgi:hydrogenase-4 component E
VTFLSETILILTILLSVFAVGTARIAMTIRTFAAQSLLIAFLPWFLHPGLPGFHQLLLMVGTLVIKVWLIPRFLFRAIRDVAIRRDVEPLITYGAALLACALLVALAFGLSANLPVPTGIASHLLLPASLSTLMIGLLLLISRTKAVTQVVGYLIVENGIYLFAIALVVEMPLLVEMGILLDIFVGVFVMGIVIFRINREFDHMDTHNLTALKD